METNKVISGMSTKEIREIIDKQKFEILNSATIPMLTAMMRFFMQKFQFSLLQIKLERITNTNTTKMFLNKVIKPKMSDFSLLFITKTQLDILSENTKDVKWLNLIFSNIKDDKSEFKKSILEIVSGLFQQHFQPVFIEFGHIIQDNEDVISKKKVLDLNPFSSEQMKRLDDLFDECKIEYDDNFNDLVTMMVVTSENKNNIYEQKSNLLLNENVVNSPVLKDFGKLLQNELFQVSLLDFIVNDAKRVVKSVENIPRYSSFDLDMELEDINFTEAQKKDIQTSAISLVNIVKNTIAENQPKKMSPSSTTFTNPKESTPNQPTKTQSLPSSAHTFDSKFLIFFFSFVLLKKKLKKK